MAYSAITRREAFKILGAGLGTLLLGPAAFGGTGVEPKFRDSELKGIIFLVGDGMPFSVLSALETFRNQFQEGTAFYDRLRDPKSRVTFMGTSSLSSIVTDSAPASVAWATGVKTANRFLSCLPNGQKLKTILEIANENGIDFGLVTTTRVTHATPAAWYSQRPDRDEEELIAEDALRIRPKILMGGGLRYFDQNKNPKLKKDLLGEFLKAGYTLATTRKELMELDGSKPILGLFNSSHLDYRIDRMNDPKLSTQPSLAEMTWVALQTLQGSKKGFILQIEAGRIDHANHANDAYSALQDTAELDEVIDVINRYLEKNPETLVIIVSDHGTAGFSVFGTGPEYNDSTESLLKYKDMKASIPYITRLLHGKGEKEVKEIVENLTGFAISDREAEEIIKSLEPAEHGITGNYLYRAYDTSALGAILARCRYPITKSGDHHGKPEIRRGNIYFVSTTHTAEDQLVLAYGYKAQELIPPTRIENTYLFNVLLSFFGLPFHKNPSMKASEAKALLKEYAKFRSPEDEYRGYLLHVS